ncbi:MAG: putative rane protein, partial [Acidobacteria bacterium]|nr:putative rane protein [Acidobacteriota bacterium]
VFLGILVPKRMRIMILVQRDSNMKPVVPGENCYVDVSAEAFLADAIAYAVSVYKSAANIKLLPAEERFVRVLDSPSDSDTLDMCSGECGWGKDIGAAGATFRRFMRTGGAAIIGRLVLGLGAPVVVFAVRKFTDGNDGAGLGPLQDYVTVDFCKDESTMAHEIGHACALWHTEGSLMQRFKDGRPATLEKWQVALMRQSPHVTFF